ncbi:putative late blight resistance protein homolog R1B-16 [Salvia miltiorrhiza]|uniref:putative late blight resistance protein homolog R1B-16 n=1 Tax=Salvia miltiorrhiza TaxID=226208 RepID=UPI0025AC6BBC|nr:putative late blight resistance protein homolog R1B-16 [Salvia miltiorrhiza]
MCLKEVKKQRFYHIIEESPSVVNNGRRVVFPSHSRWREISEVLGSLSHARSIICDEDEKNFEMPHNLRLLRTFKAYDRDTYRPHYTKRRSVHFLHNVFQLVNSRHLTVRVHWRSKFPSSINLLWNLSTLIVHQSAFDKYWDINRCSIDRRWHDLVAPIEIWKLHQLRHLEFMGEGLILPDPPSDIVIMENLQTLRGAKNLYLNEEVVKRIPNVKKLHLIYKLEEMEGCLKYVQCLSKSKQMGRAKCLSYLECLSKLENLYCSIYDGCDEYLQRIRFSHSLKKLKLSLDPSLDMDLEEILQKIGSLPFLQKLVLKGGTFKTGKWDTIEGQFRRLKLLALDGCRGLQNWVMAESSHFPLLQELRLESLYKLEEIPSEVGEIPTLESISLEYCSESVVVSVKKIVEEQEDLYGDQLDLHVRALVWKGLEALQSMASPNFEVKVADY